MIHLLLWGNSYSQIIRDGMGRVVGLYPLLPNHMSVDRDEHGEIFYTYTPSSDSNPNLKGTQQVKLRRQDVLHIPGLGFDGLVGYSPIAMARNAVGMTLACEEYDSRLIDVLNEECIMRNLGSHITTSGERKINIAATKPAASWIEEGGALSFGDATFDQIIMDAYKLHVAIKVTEELLYDAAFNLESYIIQQFGKAIANAEEDAFLNGDGNHKPTGLLTTAQTGVTTSGASITADDLIELVYKLKRPYRKSAAFIVNDQTLAAIRKLKDANQAYMWQPSYQMGEPDRLLGYPIHTTPFMPTAEAGKTALVFGDYSYYNIGDRGSRSIQELRELFAGNGMIAFVMKERVDGKLVLPEAVQMLKIKGTAGKG